MKTYATANAFRIALEDRLRVQARSSGIALARLRKSVVFERLLARLLVVAPDRWHLKGALALDFRFGTGVRSTKDMDLGRMDDEAASLADFRAAQALDLHDWFVLDIARTDALDQLVDGAAVRYRVAATVAGRLFEQVTVDVGFSDLHHAPELITGPTFLRFAGLEPLAIPALPLAHHVAEKLHAYTRQYGQGRQNTRTKDLVDLVLIQAIAELQAGPLLQAIREVFASRQTHPLPATLPLPPDDWVVSYRVLAQEVGLATELLAGFQAVTLFLDPLLLGEVAPTMQWQPASHCWRE